MTKPIMDKLKEHLDGWELSIRVREQARQVAKRYLKECEEELVSAKRCVYQTNKAWVEARKEAKSAKQRLSAYPSKKRQWAKKNMGKIISSFDTNTHKEGER